MSESKLDDVAPYMTGAKKGEADEKQTEKKKCTPFGRCYIVGVSLVTLSFLVVIVASFFQQEFQSMVASFTPDTVDEAVEVAQIAKPVTVIEDEIITNSVVPVIEPPTQATIEAAPPFYAYQPFSPAVAQNNVFADMQQKHRTAIEESMRQHNTRFTELDQLRTARFERIQQDRIARLNRFETMRAKTQAIQQEMQQKMQQAYNDFHSI